MRLMQKARLLTAAVLLAALPLASGAAGLSHYFSNHVLDHIFRGTAYTAPTVICLALVTSAPTAASTGATIAEAAYTGYARAQLNPSVSNWKGTGGETSGASAGTTQTIKNAVLMTFGTAATSGPTTVTHMVFLDNCTVGAGNHLGWADIADKTVNNGDPAPTIAIDAATFGLQ